MINSGLSKIAIYIINLFLFIGFFSKSVYSQPDSLITEAEFIENLLFDYKIAIGGEKALKKLKSLTIKQTINVEDVFYNVTRHYNMSGKMTKIMSAEGQIMEKLTCTGNKAARWGVRGIYEFSGKELEVIKHESYPLLPLEFKKEDFTLSYDTTLYVNGVKSHKITALTKQHNVYHFYFDQAFGYLIRWEILKQYEEEDYYYTYDYLFFKEIEGYTFPYEMELTKKDLKLKYKVALIEVNPKYEKDIFEIGN